jgi:hypothetical protein
MTRFCDFGSACYILDCTPILCNIFVILGLDYSISM